RSAASTSSRPRWRTRDRRSTTSCGLACSSPTPPMATPSARRTARRCGRRARPRRWSWSRGCSTSAGKSRSKPRRWLLLRFRTLARFDVLLKRFHGLADSRRVLRPEQPAGKSKQARHLVVHLVSEPRRPVLALRVGVGPGAFERSSDEPAAAFLRLAPDVLLDLDRL